MKNGDHSVNRGLEWAPDFAAPGWEPMSFFQRNGKTAIARPGLSAIAEALRSK